LGGGPQPPQKKIPPNPQKKKETASPYPNHKKKVGEGFLGAQKKKIEKQSGGPVHHVGWVG